MLSTVRQTMLQLENAIASSLMHVNWSQLRKHWVNAVASSSSPRDFARAIIVLQACMKPAIYAPVWQESLGKNSFHIIFHAINFWFIYNIIYFGNYILFEYLFDNDNFTKYLMHFNFRPYKTAKDYSQWKRREEKNWEKRKKGKRRRGGKKSAFKFCKIYSRPKTSS